jgi:Ca2+-binding EF-hand superfamily protein
MFYKVFVVFILYLGAGVVYGMAHMEWTFIRSLFFSISALSTGGLQAPEEPVDRDDPLMWMVVLWLLTGVPVFALFLGLVANAAVASQQEALMLRQMQENLSKAEMEFVAQMGDVGDVNIDFCEFFQFKLLRMGFLTRQQLDNIRDQFKELDVDGSGELTPDEMNAALCFDDYDVDRSGHIDLAEFINLAKYMQLSPDLDVITSKFDELSGGDGELDKGDFVTWYCTKGKALLAKKAAREERRTARALKKKKSKKGPKVKEAFVEKTP